MALTWLILLIMLLMIFLHNIMCLLLSKKAQILNKEGAEANSDSTIMAMPQNLDAIITFDVALTPALLYPVIVLFRRRQSGWMERTDVRFCEISDAERITGSAIPIPLPDY